MIIKINDTAKCNVVMTINIDDEAEEISIHIQHHNKQTGVVRGYDYPAEEYWRALADYRRIVKDGR